MKWLVTFALGVIAGPAIHIVDVDGLGREPLNPAPGHVQVIFFIDQTCPISNYYAHEIRRICDAYGPRGASCALVYVDPTLSNAEAKKHAAEYGHGGYPKMVDRKHALVKAAGVTVTPEAVTVKSGGTVAYRGRIDNYYADLGKARRIATEHDLRDALDAVLAGRDAPKPETKAVGCAIPALKFYGISSAGAGMQSKR